MVVGVVVDIVVVVDIAVAVVAFEEDKSLGVEVVADIVEVEVVAVGIVEVEVVAVGIVDIVVVVVGTAGVDIAVEIVVAAVEVPV